MNFKSLLLIGILSACFQLSKAQETAQASKQNEAPSARSGYAFAYDANRGVAVLFGGQDANSKRLGDTWEWNNGWKKISISGPPARINAAIAYDDELKKVVIFGGSTDAGTQNDTWTYDGHTWKKLGSNSPLPPARQITAMVFDKKQLQLVLFGGWDANKKRTGDTWTMKDNQWNKLDIPGPPPRASHAMVYDDDSGSVFVYGGYDTTALKDLWEFKDGKWKNIDSKKAPSRLHMAIGYDKGQKRILVFGGFGDEGRTNELWQYSNNTWTQIKQDSFNMPDPRAEHKGVFIPGKGLLIFGGIIGVDPNTRNRGNDTWLYNGTVWQKE